MMTKPDPAAVGCRAAEILDLVVDSEEYGRLTASTRPYPDCWATFYRVPDHLPLGLGHRRRSTVRGSDAGAVLEVGGL